MASFLSTSLGLMVSAVAFSLVGPAATQSMEKSDLLGFSIFEFILGAAVIASLKMALLNIDQTLNHIFQASNLKYLFSILQLSRPPTKVS